MFEFSVIVQIHIVLYICNYYFCACTELAFLKNTSNACEEKLVFSSKRVKLENKVNEIMLNMILFMLSTPWNIEYFLVYRYKANAVILVKL